MKIETLNCPTCGAPIEIRPRPYQAFDCPACRSALMLTDFTGTGAIICEKCETVNDPSQRFCTACHAAIQAGCPYCYAQNPIDAGRCRSCGIDLQRAWGRQQSWLESKAAYDSERREATQQAIQASRQSEIKRLLIQLDEPQNHPMAIFSLQQYGKDAVTDLISALHSSDPDARYGAAHTLGLIGDRSAIPGLLDALVDPEVAVRFWAADALGRLKASEAVPALLALRKDKSKTVREKARITLQQIDSSAAREALKKW